MKFSCVYFLSCLLGIAVISCESSRPEEPSPAKTRFEYLSPDYTGVHFSNKVHESPHRNVGTYDYMYNGGGVAVADFNNDGLPDLFFTGNDVPNKLYINKGGFKFEDVSEKAGIGGDGKWATGVTVVDINDDGWPDIYVCHSGPDYRQSETRNALYINQQDGTFREESTKYGIHDNGLSTHAVFFDMDGDGDLDLWVLNHAVRNWANQTPDWLKVVEQFTPQERKRFTNSLYRNEGDGRFTEISEDAGIDFIGFGLGIAVSDFNRDGRPDVFIANDYFIPDRLFINLGNGGFAERSSSKFSHTPHFSMGCDAADFNNDGLIDLAVLDMTPADHYRNKMNMSSMDVAEFRFLTKVQGYRPQYMFNSLFRNDGNGVMSDIAHLAGVAKTDWSWAPLLVDLDNDGLRDLYITNGIYRDILNNDWRGEIAERILSGQLSKEEYFNHLQKADRTPVVNPMFQNQNGYEFSAVQDGWGINRTSFSNGAAYVDLNQDGHLDLVVSNIGQPAFIIRNNGKHHKGGSHIRFTLESTSPDLNEEGTRISVFASGKAQVAEYRFNRGFQSFVEPAVHFGLGDAQRVDSVKIHWPNRRVTTLQNLQLNHSHHIQYDPATAFVEKTQHEMPLFADVSDAAIVPPAVHIENEFDDFEKEILLPHRMSQLGPALAVADVNGDGLDDFYVGGALDKPGMLYLQTPQGYFHRHSVSAFEDNAAGEELGAAFFDFDGDGHLDLYVARGGGGEVEDNKKLMQDVLYRNDGKGSYAPVDALPEIHSSTMAVRPVDWNNDGQMDLFVGGRNTPGKYPTIPCSYLLENHNGKFVDVTKDKAPDLAKIGMVTDAMWVQNDDQLQLLVVGEWMSPTWFEWNDGVLARSGESEIEVAAGWWNSIAAADFNNDGQNDYVLGNLGLNNKFHPTQESPLYCFANDFDDNGTLDIVLSKNYKDKLVPMRGKECSSAQMPVLLDEFKSYHEFASAGLTEIYDAQKIESALSLKADNFSSGILSRKSTEWVINELPLAAQVAPIQGVVIDDFDNDGHLDMVLAGNNFVTEVETTPYDSGKGLFLKGDGNGSFEAVYTDKSGVFLPGDVRAILPISVSTDGIRGLLVVENDGKVRLLIRTGE